jgi:hypothetical protein
MRAGPLSDARVIAQLNRAFVCVYTVNEDYRGSGAAPAEERAELQRIHREGYKKKLSVGTVHAYVLTPDGHTHDSLHVATASRTDKLLAMLERAVSTFKPKEGKPIVAPVSQSAPPKAPADALVLHLVSRADAHGSWGEFPGENWIVLPRSEWSKLLPEGADSVKAGQSWELNKDVTARVLTYFYPQTENNDATTARIEKHSLRAKVLSVEGGVVRARLDGTLRMMHSFYPRRMNPEPIDATVVGILTFTPGKQTVPSLQLVTASAIHGKRKFSVAVWSLPASKPD